MEIEITNLRKHFGKTKAVDDISFTFASGDVFGFVGPNGAGKTTTMRILATLEEPSGGDACFDGVSVVEEPEKVRYKVGFVPDSLPTHSDITVHEYLDFFARAYGISGKQREKTVEGIEEFTNVVGIREKLLKSLSKGMKQRVSLGRAMIHDPEVLVMDEPASGLDPRARVELRELLSILAGQGKAILVSSHILTELTEICNGVVIIERGKLLETGRLEDVVAKTAPVRVVTIRPLCRFEEVYRTLLETPGVENVRRSPGELRAEVAASDEICCDLLMKLVQCGYRIAEFKQHRTDLEDVFMRITKGDLQ